MNSGRFRDVILEMMLRRARDSAHRRDIDDRGGMTGFVGGRQERDESDSCEEMAANPANCKQQTFIVKRDESTTYPMTFVL